MDLANSVAKNPESETEISNRIRPAKISTFTNGVLKRHAPLQLHHNGHFPVAVAYKECLKNHAATLGGHALDGCGEFMPPPPSIPASLKCAACGCHRNFHRREPEPPVNAIPALEFQPHHRHHLRPPHNNGESSPEHSPSPPPISSAYYPSAPHVLLALSHGNNTSIPAAVNTATAGELNSGSRKRYRTKFTQFQKERMLEFAERVGWRMEKRNDDAMNEFCAEVGVDRAVFKVWMHNNKNIFAKKDQQQPPPPPPHLSNNASETSTPPLPSANGNGAAAYHHQHDGSSNFHGEETEAAEADQLHLLK